MLKLYLCAEGPSLAEVIAQIDDGMWKVEASVAGVVLVRLRLTVTADMVAVEVTREHDLAIAAYTEAVPECTL